MVVARKLIVAAAVLGISAPAMAADLYVRPDAPVMAPAATDWDGLYLGASIGGGWGSLTRPGASADTAGWSIGGQLGYNFGLAGVIVAGVEGDINWSGETGNLAGASFRKNWDGSLSGRLGVDIDGILPYAEGGVAIANATLGPDSATHTGWTAGAGIEFKVADPVSLNVEYRYADYGTATYGGVSHKLADNSVRVGVNYHF